MRIVFPFTAYTSDNFRIAGSHDYDIVLLLLHVSNISLNKSELSTILVETTTEVPLAIHNTHILPSACMGYVILKNHQHLVAE